MLALPVAQLAFSTEGFGTVATFAHGTATDSTDHGRVEVTVPELAAHRDERDAMGHG